jgi:glycosyltransferase involved in cell wall biosynthesis
MKINLIIPSFYPAVIYGGPIFSTLHTCQELAKLDDVEIYVSTTNANMTSRLDVEIGKYIKLENDLYVKYYNETILNKLSISLIFGISNDIKNSDVVHIQSIFSISTPISLYFAKRYNKPILLSPRGQFGRWCLENGSRMKGKWLKYFIKPFINNIFWHATAQQEKDEILSIFSDAKVEIIPNGIYIDEFKKSNKLKKQAYLKKFTNHNIENVDKLIVGMGRLQKKKGFDILIDSFYDVLKQYPNSYLLIAGPDEGEKENLDKQIKKLGLEDKIFLIGNIENQEKIDFLANADLFVLPSHNENFGNVYIESLASGTPIVASHGTPWNEVEKYDCGKWVENSVEKTSEAMIEMLKKDREKMRQNSIKLASKYDWSSIAKQFKNFFEDMINE